MSAASKRRLTVGDLMSSDPTSLGPDSPLREVEREFRLGRIRHLPIVDEEQNLLGLLTHRDLLAAGDDWTQPIKSVMRTDVKTVGQELPAYEAAYLLIRYTIGCLPVTTEQGKLVGILTDTDFVRVAYTLLGGKVPAEQLQMEEESS